MHSMKLRNGLYICHHNDNVKDNRSSYSSDGKRMQVSVCADRVLLEPALVCNLQVVSLHKHF